MSNGSRASYWGNNDHAQETRSMLLRPGRGCDTRTAADFRDALAETRIGRVC